MAKVNTVKEIENAKAKSTEYKLTVDRGLYIRVAPSGIKTWLVRYVVDGHQIQYRLPEPYGDGEGFFGLADAKALNANIQSLARKGIDYKIQLSDQKQTELQLKQAVKEKEKLDTENNLTFQDLYAIWIKDGVSRADKNAYIVHTFKKYALPAFGKIQVRTLTEHHLRKLYRDIIAKGRNATAAELSKDILQMLRWGEKRAPWRRLLVEGNPAELVEINKLLPHDYVKERDRMLSIDEIKKLKVVFDSTAKQYATALCKYDVERPLKKRIQIAMWLCLSTLCRIGELLMTEWQHVDFENRTWFKPAANTKGRARKKTPHIVYLSDFSLNQFNQLKAITGGSKWAFPAVYTDNHVCVKSASKQIGDRQVQFKQRTKKLQFRVENNSLVLGDREWTPHDLRRTGATMMQQLKVPREIINLCQHHAVGSKVDKSYLLEQFADERREASEKLGNHLEAILSADNVISIKHAA
ncbi:MAG TPA: tyrosine-type recombinase/integrase [Methylotenera sp.]|nr:tyrosine-type recombinase/integrase [Methylotenera sp.]HPH08565.1 tyrosine-type recombinase/integrase [Methylotenera sp.]HPM48699.1 tyrosine-type recombinase/integrase [Methylotenera sp.]